MLVQTVVLEFVGYQQPEVFFNTAYHEKTSVSVMKRMRRVWGERRGVHGAKVGRIYTHRFDGRLHVPCAWVEWKHSAEYARARTGINVIHRREHRDNSFVRLNEERICICEHRKIYRVNVAAMRELVSKCKHEEPKMTSAACARN